MIQNNGVGQKPQRRGLNVLHHFYMIFNKHCYLELIHNSGLV